MKKRLLKLPDAVLNKIAADFGVTEGTREEKATKVADYIYRSYGLRWTDLTSRYGLDN